MSRRVRRTYWDVVLAEDNDDHAVLIRMALERASKLPVEVRRARNGDEAVELVEAQLPDLLLLDLKMPGRALGTRCSSVSKETIGRAGSRWRC